MLRPCLGTFLPLAGALLLLEVPPAEACACGTVGPPCAEYWSAAAIFRGRVEAIASVAPSSGDPVGGKLVTFSVLEPLKGVDRLTRVEIRTAGSRRACGYSFVRGREYLVYATRGAGGGLTTGICSRTRPADRADDDLAYAGRVAAGEALGRISGRVVLRTRDLVRGRNRDTPMRNVPVVLQRGEFSLSTVTDAAGVFRVGGLEPGSYQAALDLPARFRTIVFPPQIELPDVRGCAEVKAAVLPDGRVTGRVMDFLRVPLAGLTVELTVRDARGQIPAGAERIRTVTRNDGTYELGNVPPGTFVMGINTRDPIRSEPLPQAFHPGVLRAIDAMAVRVPAAGRIELGDFVIPSALAFVKISGVVVDAAGAPAEGARVYLRGPADRDVIYGEPVSADFVGRFAIAALVDRDYRIFAERPRPGGARGRLDISEPLPITASAPPPFLKLILNRF